MLDIYNNMNFFLISTNYALEKEKYDCYFRKIYKSKYIN